MIPGNMKRKKTWLPLVLLKKILGALLLMGILVTSACGFLLDFNNPCLTEAQIILKLSPYILALLSIATLFLVLTLFIASQGNDDK